MDKQAALAASKGLGLLLLACVAVVSFFAIIALLAMWSMIAASSFVILFVFGVVWLTIYFDERA